ncbi:MAG: MazG nucleotide pyrophosphohydrolase domain-containing protein [Candidatus Bathyarchaeia archaeon]
MRRIPEGTVRSIKDWQQIITEWAIKKGFKWTKNDVNTMLLRIHSEVSEASEAIRDQNFEGFAEELADIFIRLVNLCEVQGVNLEKEVITKYNKNLDRPYLHGRKKK